MEEWGGGNPLEYNRENWNEFLCWWIWEWKPWLLLQCNLAEQVFSRHSQNSSVLSTDMAYSHGEYLPQQWGSWIISQLEKLQTLFQGVFSVLPFIFAVTPDKQKEGQGNAPAAVWWGLFPSVVILLLFWDFSHLLLDPPRRGREWCRLVLLVREMRQKSRTDQYLPAVFGTLT